MKKVFGLTLAVLLLGATTALAKQPLRLSVKLEPAAAFPLGGPQKDAFGVGGGGFLKGAYGPLDWLDLQLTVGGLAFSPEARWDTPGIIAVGGGARLQLPQKRRISPFVDFDLLYVRTGKLNRFGYAAAGGVLFALDRRSSFWIGPFVRYLQVVESQEPGYDTTDASLLLVGVSVQLGSARRTADVDSDNDGLLDGEDRCPLVVGPRENDGCPWGDKDRDGVLDRADKCPTGPGPPQNDGCPWPDTDGDGLRDPEDRCPKVPGLRRFGGCPDQDRDGVPEPPDLCPTSPGPADNNGCPRYSRIVVTPKRIELNQKIFFAYDRAEILPKSFGLLQEVAKAFGDYPGLRVRIEGHTDSTGSLQHNMRLSDSRANAVLTYLVDQGGVAADRLSARGYGPSQPLDTNRTSEGRERNRRVEFVIEGLGASAAGAPAPERPPRDQTPDHAAPGTKPKPDQPDDDEDDNVMGPGE